MRRLIISLCGLLLLCSTLVIVSRVSIFADSTELQSIITVIIMMLAGALFLYIYHLIKSSGESRPFLLPILVGGLLFRLMMLFSVPILEDDYFRYLWDGAVVADGHNPYAYSPEEILRAAESAEPSQIPSELLELATHPNSTIRQVNHAYVRSIYPVVTQAFWGLSHFLAPWSLTGWRLLLLVIDILVVFLLLRLLREAGLPAIWSAIYWLNPLIIKESLNSVHMDVLTLPLILAAFLFCIRKKPLLAVVFLALATGTKVWPLFLLPLLLKYVWPNWRMMLAQVVLYSGLVLLMFLPIALSGLDANTGFSAYGQRWELNDALFGFVRYIAEQVLILRDIHPGHGQLWARVSVAAIWMIIVAWFTFRLQPEPVQLFNSAALIMSGVFFFSPTQFPWYALWILPFLTLAPRFSLLMLTALMPIYYLRYYFLGVGNEGLFDSWLVWLQYIPVWVILFREWLQGQLYETPMPDLR